MLHELTGTFEIGLHSLRRLAACSQAQVPGDEQSLERSGRGGSRSVSRDRNAPVVSALPQVGASGAGPLRIRPPTGAVIVAFFPWPPQSSANPPAGEPAGL